MCSQIKKGDKRAWTTRENEREERERKNEATSCGGVHDSANKWEEAEKERDSRLYFTDNNFKYISKALALKNRLQVFFFCREDRVASQREDKTKKKNSMKRWTSCDVDYTWITMENENYSRWKILICVGWKNFNSTWPVHSRDYLLSSYNFLTAVVARSTLAARPQLCCCYNMLVFRTYISLSMKLVPSFFITNTYGEKNRLAASELVHWTSDIRHA